MRYFGEEKPALDELTHYGVKGMKWGVRKSEGSSGNSVSRSDKKAAKKNLNKIYEKVGEKRLTNFLKPAITEDRYSRLSTKEVRIAKGQTIGRVSNRADEKFRGSTYVSYTPKDRVRYQAVMPEVNKGKKHYEYTYKAMQTLRGPSEKARIDIFRELMDSPTVKLKNGKTVTGRDYLTKLGYGRDVKRLDSQKLALQHYQRRVAQAHLDTPLTSAYFEKLRSKGYNIVSDDNDRGILSDEPLVVLNPNGTLKSMAVKQLTKEDINRAQRAMTSV